MRKLILIAGAVAALAVPAVASADPVSTADGYQWNEPALATEQGSLVGEYTSQITHNGPWVQEQIGTMGGPGRSGVVQWVQAQDGHGRINNGK
jgi:hypothetical protein